LLREGEIDVLGRMPWSSNATLLVNITDGDSEMLAIYKPQRGERPLWDFPRGTLCHREVAAFEVSEALGWEFVPDTVLRDGPHGIGSVQRYVEHDPEEHYFTLMDEHGDVFRRMAAFDVVINNTDRKGGHCLRALDGSGIFGIDHGISFHTQWKLRTVIWDYAGEAIPNEVLEDLRKFVKGGLASPLADMLAPDEQQALLVRVQALADYARFPEDRSGHRYPWPLV